MLPCKYRRKGWFRQQNMCCSRDNESCDLLRWAWCKGIIFVIFAAFAIAYFAYGVIYVWQNAEDRSEIRRNQESFAKKAAEMDAQLKRMKQVNLTVTAYSPRKEETDATPHITAFQRPVKTGIIAISRDLERLYGWKQGDIIELEGLGRFEVGDRMNRRWTKRVDIFHWFAYDAREFGVKNVRGWKIDA